MHAQGATRATSERIELGAVIAEFLTDAERGWVRDGAGRPYTREGLRELRAALRHIEAELGTMGIADVRSSDVDGVVRRLRNAHLTASWTTTTSIFAAFRALYAYAIGRGLVGESPVEEPPAAPRWESVPPPDSGPPRQVSEGSTPTEVVLALSEHATSWVVRAIVVAFVLVASAVLIELL